MKAYKKIEDLVPDSVAVLCGKGLAQIGAGDKHGGLESFKRAGKLDPSNFLPFYNIGNTLIQELRYSDALKYLEKARKLNPDMAEIHSAIGTC